MTVKLAITGKSGSGKTTIVKAFMHIFEQMYPDKSILLFDNDLTSELAHAVREIQHRTRGYTVSE